MIGAQIAMTVGVLAAALSQGKLVGHEVDYIVGLGAPVRLPRCYI